MLRGLALKPRAEGYNRPIRTRMMIRIKPSDIEISSRL